MKESGQKTIAIITFLCPYPVSDGGRFGVFSFVNDVRTMFDVTLVFPVSGNEQEHVLELRKLWPEVEIIPVYTDHAIKTNAVSQKQSLYKKLVHPIRKAKYLRRAKKEQEEQKEQKIAHDIYPFVPAKKEMITVVQQMFAQKKFDIVQVEYSDFLNLVHIIPQGSKKVFFQHENRYLILEDYFQLHKDNSLYSKYIVETTRFTEVGLMNLYDRILILNRNDKVHLKKYIPEHKLQIMPTSVPEILIPDCSPAAMADRLVFLGSQSHYPNMDAISWFAEEMLEQAFQNTGLRLYVSGFWKDGFKFQYPKINFTGFVDDIAEILQGGILIAPIRLGGGGIRIKILQAMSCGIPVISTSLITNGMDGLEHGKNIMIADTANDFIKAIDTLASEPARYKEMSKNSILYIDTYYGQANAIEVKKKIFSELLNE